MIAEELSILDLQQPTPAPSGELTSVRFRYVLIARGGKTPIEADWPNSRNYRANDPRLIDHLGRGGSYAILCGIGGLWIVDVDDMSVLDTISDLLPPTRIHRSGSGRGRHYLYIDTEEDMRTEPLRSYSIRKDGKTILDVQGEGKLAVMPGSIHPSGGLYRTLDDQPIARLDFYALRKALHERLPPDNPETLPLRRNAPDVLLTRSKPYADADPIPVLEAYHIEYKISGPRIHFRCPAPDHDDPKASCCIDRRRGNDTYCYGCKRTWDILGLIALMEGIA